MEGNRPDESAPHGERPRSSSKRSRWIAIGAAASTEAGLAAGQALLEDERRFIDHERSPLWFVEEHELVPEP